jgi:hypothetical protein
MKKLIVYCLFILCTAVLSCTKKLEQININRVNPTSLDPVLLLNNAIINTSFPTRTVIYEEAIVQQLVSPNGGVLAGGNFNQDSRDITNAPVWAVYYQNVIKYTYDVMTKTKDVAARSNLYNMARIWQAYAFMVLTDTYGAIPYTEAVKGLTDQLFFPKYDQQQDIYPKLIQELTEASAALNAGGTVETSDVLYSGSIAKWKKLGYSLLLRAGMRLSKVDAAKAQSTVQAAFAGGVITDNADNAYMRHDANYQNPIGGMLNSTEANNFYLVKAFVDTLKNNNDPRLSSIAIRYKGAKSGGDLSSANANPPAPPAYVTVTTNPADQIGMPMGYDNGTIVARATADGLASFYDYSQADRKRIVKTSAPAFFVTAAQTNLLLAEAKFRGWITGGNTAAQYFADGIKAHMDQMATYDAGCAVPAAARDAYIAAHPLTAGRELELINTQYWIASFLNGPEAFANFRRSGYPALTPNPYGQPSNPDVPNGTFIRRIGYPTSELSVNTTNVNAGIAGMGGPDKLSTRVWWDK